MTVILILRILIFTLPEILSTAVHELHKSCSKMFVTTFEICIFFCSLFNNYNLEKFFHAVICHLCLPNSKSMVFPKPISKGTPS